MPSDEPLALDPSPPAGADYDTIHAAVVETERGQWFLEEFARRNRNPDTALLLSAIHRLEDTIAGNATAAESGRYRSILEALSETLAKAGAQADESHPALQLALARNANSAIRTAARQLEEIGWQMRGQNYDEALCEAIEARIADISSGCAVLEHAAENLQGTIALLREIAARIGDALGRKVREDAVPAPTALSARFAEISDPDVSLNVAVRIAEAVGQPPAEFHPPEQTLMEKAPEDVAGLSAPQPEAGPPSLAEQCDPQVIAAIAHEINLALAAGDAEPAETVPVPTAEFVTPEAVPHEPPPAPLQEAAASEPPQPAAPMPALPELSGGETMQDIVQKIAMEIARLEPPEVTPPAQEVVVTEPAVEPVRETSRETLPEAIAQTAQAVAQAVPAEPEPEQSSPQPAPEAQPVGSPVVPFRAHLKAARDPLAPIRAMSEEEKIALFS